MLSKPPPRVIHLKGAVAPAPAATKSISKGHSTKIARSIAKGEPMKDAVALGPEYSVDKKSAAPEVKS